MQNIVTVVSGKPVTTSKIVADLFGKVHRNVMRDIEKLDCSKEFRVLNYEQSEYTSEQNKKLPCYKMTRDGFSFLCMGFTGKHAAVFKEKYIAAFNAMEETLQGGNSRSVMAALNQAMKLMEDDKDVASVCGKGLQVWKEQRKDHIARIEGLYQESQILLNFEKDKTK